MKDLGGVPVDRDLRRLQISAVGTVVETGDPLEPVQLLDADGEVDEPVRRFVQHLVACGARPRADGGKYLVDHAPGAVLLRRPSDEATELAEQLTQLGATVTVRAGLRAQLNLRWRYNSQ